MSTKILYGDICELFLERRYIILSRPGYIKKLCAPAQYYQRLPNSPGTVELGMLETDFSGWLHAFTNDVTSVLATGKRMYSIASYYNTLSINKAKLSHALVQDSITFQYSK
ncbi:13882_t:CDS:2, partial [Racocetra persica]